MFCVGAHCKHWPHPPAFRALPARADDKLTVRGAINIWWLQVSTSCHHSSSSPPLLLSSSHDISTLSTIQLRISGNASLQTYHLHQVDQGTSLPYLRSDNSSRNVKEAPLSLTPATPSPCLLITGAIILCTANTWGTSTTDCREINFNLNLGSVETIINNAVPAHSVSVCWYLHLELGAHLKRYLATRHYEQHKSNSSYNSTHHFLCIHLYFPVLAFEDDLQFSNFVFDKDTNSFEIQLSDRMRRNFSSHFLFHQYCKVAITVLCFGAEDECRNHHLLLACS